jgi:hypothetical protein
MNQPTMWKTPDAWKSAFGGWSETHEPKYKKARNLQAAYMLQHANFEVTIRQLFIRPIKTLRLGILLSVCMSAVAFYYQTNKNVYTKQKNIYLGKQRRIMLEKNHATKLTFEVIVCESVCVKRPNPIIILARH